VTTENVTVLFTDMVDSTALASVLASDDADGLRRDHFSAFDDTFSELERIDAAIHWNMDCVVRPTMPS
jgi:class 3 adenylate cyclase